MESVFKKDGTSIGIITLSDIKNVPITDIFQTNENYTMTAKKNYILMHIKNLKINALKYSRGGGI